MSACHALGTGNVAQNEGLVQVLAARAARVVLEAVKRAHGTVVRCTVTTVVRLRRNKPRGYLISQSPEMLQLASSDVRSDGTSDAGRR